MAFARWDPLRDLLAIQQHLDRFAPGMGAWQPPVDLFETADAYVLTAEVPGLKREDLEIHVHDTVVTIAGVRRERQVACETFHRVERGHGAFTRRFEFQHPVDADRVTADLRDGVLTVSCPKATDAESRRIHVS